MTKSCPTPHPLFGHLPALQRDSLGFLSECAKSSEAVIPLRIPFLRVFLLLGSDDIERVLVLDHRNFVKPLWLRTPSVQRLLGDGLVTSDGDAWKEQRRVCRPAFHPGSIEGYGNTIASLVGRMLEEWKPGQTRQVQNDLMALTLEIIGTTLLGTDISGETGEISASMAVMMECFTEAYRLFGVMPLPPSRREARAVRRLDAAIDRIIESRTADAVGKGGDGSSVLMESLCDYSRRPEVGPDLAHRELREQIKTFLAAGHESSALSLTWAFILLAQNPAADARLAEELRGVLGNRPPTPTDVPNLSYTGAVIKEALRLYSPLWMTGRKALNACEIGGCKIPAGALLLTSQWAVHRSERYFPDPGAFRPERWLDGSLDSLPRFAYFPFGGGPRVCIGQSFAVMETALLLASISRRFQLELLDETPILPWATMTLRPPRNLKMRLNNRSMPGSV